MGNDGPFVWYCTYVFPWTVGVLCLVGSLIGAHYGAKDLRDWKGPDRYPMLVIAVFCGAIGGLLVAVAWPLAVASLPALLVAKISGRHKPTDVAAMTDEERDAEREKIPYRPSE